MLRRYTPLARTTGPARKQPLAQQSKKGRAGKAAQRQAYAAADDAEQCWCSACGRAGATDHSHHFTQGRHKLLANDQRNWIRLCRADHELFEHNKRAFAARYPQVWQQILSQMQQVNPQAHAFFRMKNPF